MSAAVAAAAAAACVSSNNTTSHTHHQRNQQNYRSVSFFPTSPEPAALLPALSRYESQKRRDWNTFVQYLKKHCPTFALSRCTGAHVLDFLKYLDQFGETKVHTQNCPFFGHPHSPTPCSCPLKEAWESLDAIIGRLRAAYEENGGGQSDPMNPFRAPEVRVYLREVRDTQAEARGIAYI